MKNFYIKVLVIMAATTALLSAALSAAAEEYKSMIRYDRVWECVSTRWFDNTVYYMRFDGTEEINGKTYHKLVTFRKAGFDWKDNGKTLFTYDVSDDIIEHEGYMREENGVVYTLIANDGAENPDSWSGTLYIPTNDNSDYPDVTEEIIYDFNCKEGDSYDGISYLMCMAQKESFTVESIDKVEIDGEECRRFEITNRYCDKLYPVIEGVGAVVEGCLNCHEFLDAPTFPWGHHFLNRVFNNEGDVLYRTPVDCLDIPNSLSGVDAVSDIRIKNPGMYDIYGRRITAPAPGQMYIKDGKKHIAR